MFNIPTSDTLKALNIAEAIDHKSDVALNFLRDRIQEAHELFWHGPMHPNEIYQAVGPEAGMQMFAKSATVQDFIAAMDTAHVPLGVPEQYRVNWNDGHTMILSIDDAPKD